MGIVYCSSVLSKVEKANLGKRRGVFEIFLAEVVSLKSSEIIYPKSMKNLTIKIRGPRKTNNHRSAKRWQYAPPRNRVTERIEWATSLR